MSIELSVDMIKRRSGHYDLGLVTLLDVSRMKISRLAQLEHCVNLHELNLADNNLLSLKGLPALPMLRCLHLSNNQLTSLGSSLRKQLVPKTTNSLSSDSLPSFPLLEELSVANNQIQSINFVELATLVPSLRILDFTNNILDSSSVEAKALKAFTNLLFLNGKAFALTELFKALRMNTFEAENGDDLAVPYTDPEGKVDLIPHEDIGFKENITCHLEDLLRQCNQTLANTEPELVFPASSSSISS